MTRRNSVRYVQKANSSATNSASPASLTQCTTNACLAIKSRYDHTAIWHTFDLLLEIGGLVTLVVGRIVDGKTYIFADTALTSPIQQKVHPYTDGCLKCYIVNDRLALAFADASAAFEHSCETLLNMHSAAEIVQYAVKAQAEGWQVEVLIADAGSNEIWTVKDGIVAKSSAGFLGDAEAFNSFQKYLNDPDSIPHKPPAGTVQFGFCRIPEPVSQLDIYAQMLGSFKAVIEDGAHPTVGGAAISLCTHNGIFQYLNYAAVFSPFDEKMLNGQPIPFGTAANGGYAVELCTDEDGKEPAFYFLQGGFGLLFPREGSGFRRALVLQAENPAYFALESSKTLMRQLKSGYGTPDHFGEAGESLYKLDRYEDALWCYELGNGYEALRERPQVRDRYIGGFASTLYHFGDRERALAMLNTCIAEQPFESKVCTKVLSQIR